MTAASDGAAGDASDKTLRYEQIRARILDQLRAPIAAVSAAVLVRQGMSAWMQLDDDCKVQDSPQSRAAQPRTRLSLPGAKQTELLSVLTDLVFKVCKPKESA